MRKICVFFVLIFAIFATKADEFLRFNNWVLIVKEDKFTDEKNIQLEYQPSRSSFSEYNLTFSCQGHVTLIHGPITLGLMALKVRESAKLIKQQENKSIDDDNNQKLMKSVTYRLDKQKPVTQSWKTNEQGYVYTDAAEFINKIKNGKKFIIKLTEENSRIYEFNLDGLHQGYDKFISECSK